MAITDQQVKQLLKHPKVTGDEALGIIIVDIDGIVHFANPLWAKMHGYKSTRELLGKHISKFHTNQQMKMQESCCTMWLMIENLSLFMIFTCRYRQRREKPISVSREF